MTDFTRNYNLNKPIFDQSIWHDDVNENFDIIDAIMFAFTGVSNFVGSWTNATVYTEGQRVFDEVGGGIYQVAVAHTSNSDGTFEEDRTLHPTYWTSVSTIPNVRGEWDNGVVYNVGDMVYDSSEGIFGQANQQHTSIAVGTMRDDIAKFNVIFDFTVVIETAPAASVPFTPAGTIESDNVQDAIEEVVSDADAKYAPKANPVFTGNPTAPTPSPGDNDTSVATTAYVTDAITTAVTAALAAIRDGVSSSFDTLAEIVAGYVPLGNTNYLHPVGFVADFAGLTAPAGWHLLSGGTIGDATSGATVRANADQSALFVQLWDNFSNTELTIQDSSGVGTTRGANAATDFAAHKRLPLPDLRGRVVAGKDNMGGTSANRLTDQSGGLDGDTLGDTGGSETHQLIIAELAAHTHGAGSYETVENQVCHDSNNINNNQTGGGGNAINSVQEDRLPIQGTSGSTGSGTAHNNVQPTYILSKIIKY